MKLSLGLKTCTFIFIFDVQPKIAGLSDEEILGLIKTFRAKYITAKRMSCAVLLATLVVVLFCGKFASFVKVISVAKPSAAQAKFLDFEIGASIHFNMQTFSRTMKPGELIWSYVLFPSIEHTVGSYLTPNIITHYIIMQVALPFDPNFSV